MGIFYRREDGITEEVPEGSRRQVKMEASANWTRLFKPLTERKEIWANIIEEQIPKKKAGRKKRS
jgi:hypothetical protein